METGKVISGTSNLVFDGVDAISTIVEGMYRNIAATPLPFGSAPEGAAPGIAGMVYSSIRLLNGVARGTTATILKPVLRQIDQLHPPGPYRDALVAALNGICGDHLATTNNALAIPMRLRVYPDQDDVSQTDSRTEELPPFSHLFESKRQGFEIYPANHAHAESGFAPKERLLVLLHGLCMSDRGWTADQHNHGHALAEAGGYTPVFAHYNSGLHISQNGAELAQALETLLSAWPVPVKSVTFIGFSMGGLVLRSAICSAKDNAHNWVSQVDKAVYVGTPHQGAAMERGGYWLQKSATFSPYTAPLASLGKLRSAGITDLRFGNVRDADWAGVDIHEDNSDHRNPSPLPADIEHFAIGASLSKQLEGPIADWRSDGLVHPLSSYGAHDNPALALQFDADKQRIFPDLGHLAMLSDQRVYRQLEEWLAPAS